MDRKLFRIGGISALVFAVAIAIFAAYMNSVAGPPTASAEEVLHKVYMSEMAGAFPWMGWFGTLTWMLAIPMALALYFALRERKPSYAVLALVGVLFMALLNLIHAASAPTLTWKLSQAYHGNPTEQTAALLIMDSVGRWLNRVALIGGFIPGAVGIGLFGLAMLNSQAFPRWLGWVGIAGGGLSLTSQLSYLASALMPVVFVSWLVMIAWVFVAGIYLLRIKPATT